MIWFRSHICFTLTLFLLGVSSICIGALRVDLSLPSVVKADSADSSLHILPKALPETLSKTLPKTLPKTLKDAYQAARLQSETVAIQQELLDVANELDTQSKSALFPTISGTGTFLTQPVPESATGASLYPGSQNTVKITAAQPLFRGFRDFALLRQRKSLVGAQIYTLLAASRQLFYDLSTAYYNVLAFKQDEINYQFQIESNRKRLKELDQFFKIGRSQLTDLLTFKSNISTLEAQLEFTRGQLEQAKDVLAYLTGWNREMLLGEDESSLTPTSGDLVHYLAQVEERPEVKLAAGNVKAYDEGVPIAFGAHLPSIDLLGNYYITRPGALTDVRWDLALVLTLPIFQGGLVQSQVRQAQAVARQYGLLLSQARRVGELEVRTFYDLLESDQKQLVKLGELVNHSKMNFETTTQYYRNGLVTNLDVLQAMTTYQDAQRKLDRQRYSTHLDTAKLQAATGQRPELNVNVKVNP